MAASKDMNMVWLAQSRLRRRKFDACLDICTSMLERNPRDQAVWYLKMRALTLKDWIDDLDMEEEGVGDVLMDEHAVANVPRPGTSLNAAAVGGGMSPAIRPTSASGRPLTGFARPSTANRPTTSARPGTGRSTAELRSMLKSGARPGTSARPVTQSGRFVRLGTASMAAEGGAFVDVERLDLNKYAARPLLARVLCDYMLYHDHNARKALQLAALATQQCGYNDWWWKARLGKCYYRLGLLRDAEQQFRSALRCADVTACTLELAKVYLRMDQPTAALDIYDKAMEGNRGGVEVMLAAARVHESMHAADAACDLHKRVLCLDACCVEAIACLASHHFYTDQPEVALRFYRRLLQMGVSNGEVWCNVAVCCYHAAQHDMALRCFERALSLSDDSCLADIWYNIGLVGVGIGNTTLATQCFKIAVSVDGTHADAHNNLGVLELRQGNVEAARTCFRAAQDASSGAFEAFYNGALAAWRCNDIEDAWQLTECALRAFPQHTESLELQKTIKALLVI